MIDNQLNAEREFKLFQADHANIDTADRYIRLNPDLNSSPPPLDDIENMHKLHGQVKNIYRQPYYQIMAERVAFRLMASAFYFSKESSIVYIEASHVYLCKGKSQRSMMASEHRPNEDRANRMSLRRSSERHASSP